MRYVAWGALGVLACAPVPTRSMDGASDGGLDSHVEDSGSASNDAPGRDEAMAELRAARIPIESWRFALDPGLLGVERAYFAPDYDETGWDTLASGRPWEEQGYPDYDGVAWYRARFEVPAEWEGSSVRLAAFGVDDEYDVWINGVHVAHHGEAPGRSVFNWQTFSALEPHLRFGETNVIALRVTDWGDAGGVWRAAAVQRSVPIDPYVHLLPEPVIDARPDLVELYRAAWQMAFDKVSFGNEANGFVRAFMDEGFNEQIYQWDSSFIALFARYGHRLFPVMATLDNFYGGQREDGYIQRVYSETDGSELGEPTRDEPMVNPPLFAWVEREYLRFTGDRSRLARVLPVLAAYYRWLREHVRSDSVPGLYYQTELGSGMDNTPRGGAHLGGWIDMSAQQVLAAEALAEMFELAGDDAEAAYFQGERDALRARVDEVLWNESTGWYFDASSTAQTGIMHAGAFFALLAGVPDEARAARMVAHLQNPSEFRRAHMFPTLAATDPSYNARGHYWRGGVWPPTNYAAVRGLVRYGERAFAREAAESHLDALAAIYASPPTDEGRIAPEERDGRYRTLWECYAPDSIEPATRWDDTYYSRQDFVGWTGLGPIAMLIEDVLGFEVDGGTAHVVFHLTREDRHGILRLPVGEGTVDVIVSAGSGARTIDVRASHPMTLEVRREGSAPQRYAIEPGGVRHALP